MDIPEKSAWKGQRNPSGNNKKNPHENIKEIRVEITEIRVEIARNPRAACYPLDDL